MRCDNGDVNPFDGESRIAAGELLASASAASCLAPAFTLGSALRWLGHECPDQRCCAPIDTLRASVWFIRRGPQCRTLPLSTRVLVDAPEIGDSLATNLQIMHHVNGCTRRDAIEVRYQPGRFQDRRNSTVAQSKPMSALMHAHPCEMPGPSDGDLRAIALGGRW